MIPKEQIRLLETWKKGIFEELSISEIMGISGKKTKPWVFNALKLLTKHNLLISKRKANINLYKLNLSNPFLIQTLQYLEAQNSLGFLHLDTVTEFIRKVPVKNYCLLAFDVEKKSELNACFLIKNKEVEGQIKPFVNNSKSKVNLHYITYDDFVKMLLTEEENIAKEVFRSNLLFFNGDIYYELIKEAYKNGFR
jgi:hypothetical protein